MNPYTGAGFWDFVIILFQRVGLFVTGQAQAVSDEIQLATLSCSAIACGLIGPFVVLKKMSMFANALSHTILVGIVSAFLLTSFFWTSSFGNLSTLVLGAFFAALITAGLTELFSRSFKLQSDASTGLVFTSLFAIGIIFVTLFTKNAHLGIEAVMGNVDGLKRADLKLAGVTALANVLFILLFYRKLTLIAFDESSAKILGLSIPFWRMFLFFLTALTCVASFRAVGVLVVLSLLVGPYLTARLLSKKLSQLLWITPLIGIFASFLAVASSRAILSHWNLPLSTGGLLSTFIGALFFVAAVYQKRGLKKKSKTS